MGGTDQHSRGQPDNRGVPPRRLFGVAEQDGWEREVRRTLAGEAERVRAPQRDLAGTAVTRARLVRRRRRLAGFAGVVVAVGLSTGVLVHAWPGPGEPGVSHIELFSDPVVDAPVAPHEPEPPRRVELSLAADQQVADQASTDIIGVGTRGGLVLAAADGRLADLASISNVTSAHRVGEGWAVVSGERGAARLWWVSPDGRPVAVLSGVDAVAVGGDQVAWRRGSMLSAAVLSGGDLEQRVDTRAPDGGGSPVGFLGDAVLLERTATGGAPSWDVWDPSLGDYEPGWTREVLRVYGAEPGGETAVGLVSPPSGGDQPCLARLRVAGSLEVLGRACLPDLPPLAAAAVSPDGQWLIAAAEQSRATDSVAQLDQAENAVADITGAGPDAAVLLVDLAAAFAGSPDAVTSVAGVADPADPAGQLVWVTPETAVFPSSDSVVRVWPSRIFADAPEAVEVIPLSGDTPVLVGAGTR